MSANDSPPSPKANTKRWLWRLGRLFLLFLVALAAAFVIWRVKLSKKTGRELAAIQSAGYPISLAELEEKYYPEIDSKENAALFFQRVFASIHVTDDAKHKVRILPDYQSTNKAKFFAQENSERIA